MAKIKSAWEIALEKTEDIVIDPKQIAYENELKTIRALVGTFLNDDGNKVELEEKLQNAPRTEAFHEAVKMTILQNLNLPQEMVLTDRFERIQALASLVTQEPQTLALLGQIVGFLKQYPEHKEQLINQLKEQFMPMLEQKAQEMQQKYGQQIPLNPENDPEFLKLAQSQLDKLSAQYNETLTGAKEQLKALL